MNIKDQLNDIQVRCQSLIDRAKSANRELTQSEVDEISKLAEEAVALKGKIERSEKSRKMMESIGGMATDIDPLSENGMNGHQLRDGMKGHMFLAGAQGKVTAKSIADQVHRTYGTKAFSASGAVTSSVPLLPVGPIELGKVPTSILDVLKTTSHDTPTWRYLRQTIATNNAAIVAPGATKPTSIVTVDDINGSLQVFAHLSEYVDEYLLRDNDQLSRFLATQLLYMLQSKVEDEVLNGTGTAGRMLGILDMAGIQTQAYATDKLTTLRTSALKLENLGYTADLFVVNIADWAAIETTRATSGSFDLGGPIDRAQQKIWGTQVVTSNRIPVGTALALDLDAVGLDIGSEGIEVKWDTSTGFDKNQVRARVEGRFGVSVFQPAAIVKATLAGA